MPPPLRSEIWAYFKPDEQDPDKAHCNICNKIYSRKGRTTTSLKNHLKAVHAGDFLLLESSNKEKQSNSERIVTPVQNESTHRSAHLSLEKVFLTEIEFGNSNAKSKQIDKLIGEMIALQNLPFNFVESLGFRRLIKLLAPEYNFRGSSFFTDYVRQEIYGKITAKVKQLIDLLDHMSFTYGIWSDLSSNISFLIVTCHGIAENFDRSSIILKCEKICEDYHTDDTITSTFYTTLSEWKIQTEQVHSRTRNKCSSIKKEPGDVNEIDCIVHKIEICIHSALQSQECINLVKQKCEKIGNIFNNSPLARKQLEIIQDKMNQPHVQVFRDGIVRWSTYYMFEQFLKVKDALCFYNNETEIETILPEDWNIIECCVELIKPLDEAIRELSSPHALISSVIPIIQVLRIKIEEYLTRSHDIDHICLAANTLRAELYSNLFYVFEEKIFLIATYLDPRYKHKFFAPVAAKKIKQDILKMMDIENQVLVSPNTWGAKRMKTKDSTEYCTEQPGPSKIIRPSLEDNLAMLLDSSSEDEASQTSKSDSNDAALKKELLSYQNKKRINVNENPLSWWRVHRDKLKLMSSLARRFLSPPAASFQSQQLFSGVDLINGPQLNRLDSDEAAILFFIKHNAPVFDFNY